MNAGLLPQLLPPIFNGTSQFLTPRSTKPPLRWFKKDYYCSSFFFFANDGAVSRIQLGLPELNFASTMGIKRRG